MKYIVKLFTLVLVVVIVVGVLGGGAWYFFSTDAVVSKVMSYGQPHELICKQNGAVVFDYHSTGKIMESPKEFTFEDAVSHRAVTIYRGEMDTCASITE